MWTEDWDLITKKWRYDQSRMGIYVFPIFHAFLRYQLCWAKGSKFPYVSPNVLQQCSTIARCVRFIGGDLALSLKHGGAVASLTVFACCGHGGHSNQKGTEPRHDGSVVRMYFRSRELENSSCGNPMLKDQWWQLVPLHPAKRLATWLCKCHFKRCLMPVLISIRNYRYDSQVLVRLEMGQLCPKMPWFLMLHRHPSQPSRLARCPDRKCAADLEAPSRSPMENLGWWWWFVGIS